MSLYKSPIRPYDPVIEADQPQGRIRYVRDNFLGAGVNNFTQPPAENQEAFEQLSNVMPPVKGIFERRYGTTLFSGAFAPYIATSYKRAYEYQDDAKGARRLVFTGATSSLPTVVALNEDGSVWSWGVFAANSTQRIVASRNYAYGASGSQTFKWDGNKNWILHNVESNTFSGYWTNSSCTITDDSVADPSSVVDASKLVGTAADSFVYKDISAMYTPSQQFTFSVYLKVPSGSRTVQISLREGGTFNVIAAANAAVTTAWTRFSVTGTAGSGVTLMRAIVGGNSTIGVGVEVHVYGPMLEYGPSMTSFQTTYSGQGFTDTSFPATNWGITAPVTAITVGAPSAGSVTLTSGRKYYCVFKNSYTGHLSDLSPVSASTGSITSQQIPLSNIPLSGEAQVDKKIILATVDGGDETILYELGEIPISQTTFADNIDEATLLNANIFLETDDNGVEIGVAGNAPPPVFGTLPTKHKGRIYLTSGQNLYFSKSDDELLTSTGAICGKYEEAWPASYYMDISEGAETVSALFSTGDVLYIGTQRHIRRLLGDGPLNFQKPEVVFNEVGVLNQDVMKAVFVEGRPIGAMWLTPDLRVIGSDFNTYQDVGAPIQATLNTINKSTVVNSWAMFVSDGPYDLYILAVPTGGNTNPSLYLVYDLRSKQWVTWSVWNSDTPTCALFNINVSGTPQWLVCGGSGKIWKFNASAFTDDSSGAALPITATVATPWLHLGSPSSYKFLNEVELTGNGNNLVTVQMASHHSEFATPISLVTNSAVTTSRFGTYKVYLAGKTPQRGRYVRLTVSNNDAGNNVVLDGFNIDALPFSHI